jgi:hypothetical protein
VFDQVKDEAFYKREVYNYNKEDYNRDDAFWNENRMEALSKDEKGVYKMLDTLKTVSKFKRLYNLGSILGSGFIEIDKWNIDIGPISSTFGYNDVEGLRLRGGARTYFGQNDLWRAQGFLAYGFKDNKFKYGLSAKWMINKENRLIISAGHRRDIEQIGANLTSSTDVLGRSLASNDIFSVATNDKLTNINLVALAIEMEPWQNVVLRVGGDYKTLSSASPTFSLDYVDPQSPTGVSSETVQFESTFSVNYYPQRIMTGYGVERLNANDDYASLFAEFSLGTKNFFNSDFDYKKIQFSYIQPWQIGGIGQLKSTVEAGKTFGEVPLGLLSVVPGNQSYFTFYKSFSQLDYYEFVTDTYVALFLEHNFNGRFFSRIPFLRKLNWREIVGIRGVWGELSDANKALSSPTNIPLQAPTDEIYYEYSVGIGNIFKLMRIDFNFRGNYFDNPEARDFGVTINFGFRF